MIQVAHGGAPLWPRPQASLLPVDTGHEIAAPRLPKGASKIIRRYGRFSQGFSPV
jgi:hypothetical protein